MLCPFDNSQMALAQESQLMQVWACEACKARPAKWRRERRWSGTLVMSKVAGVQPMTTERLVERAVAQERRRQEKERDRNERLDEIDRLDWDRRRSGGGGGG